MLCNFSPEGMEQFCQDLKLEPENVVMLCIAFKMRAKNMGFFTLQEWQQGLADAEVLCDSVEKLQKKIGYFRQMLNDPAEFKKIFRFAFDFARDKDQRSMDIETAKAMLALLLGKTWPLFSEFDEFLHLPKAPRVINKDQWNNIYEFSTLIQTDLSNYCVDGAWPVVSSSVLNEIKNSIHSFQFPFSSYSTISWSSCCRRRRSQAAETNKFNQFTTAVVVTYRRGKLNVNLSGKSFAIHL